MTPDDATLMAYADGELDALTARRVERAIAEAPELAARVEAHRSLRAQLAAAFPLPHTPDPLEAMIRTAPVPLRPKPAPARRQRWVQAGAMAACLAIGVAIGGWPRGPISTDGSGVPVASGHLAHALDTQLASEVGETRVLVSFRNGQGHYCRVFTGAAIDGIACRDDGTWRLVRTSAGAAEARSEFRQAGSRDMALVEAAQQMMTGDTLDPVQERAARQRGWKP